MSQVQQNILSCRVPILVFTSILDIHQTARELKEVISDRVHVRLQETVHHIQKTIPS